MNIFPEISVERFEKLQPGDLFVYMHDEGACFALKTDKPSNDDRCQMVVLGPEFPYDAVESFIMPWQPTTVLSFGSSYTLRLPTDSTRWTERGDRRKPVCLALCGQDVYICTNGGPSPHRYFPCYVEMKSGKIIESNLPGISAFTNSWEVVLADGSLTPRSLLKFPLGNPVPEGNR